MNEIKQLQDLMESMVRIEEAPGNIETGDMVKVKNWKDYDLDNLYPEQRLSKIGYTKWSKFRDQIRKKDPTQMNLAGLATGIDINGPSYNAFLVAGVFGDHAIVTPNGKGDYDSAQQVIADTGATHTETKGVRFGGNAYTVPLSNLTLTKKGGAAQARSQVSESLSRIDESVDHSKKYLRLIAPWKDSVSQDGVDPSDLAMDLIIDNPWIIEYYRQVDPAFASYSKGQIRQQVAIDLA